MPAVPYTTKSGLQIGKYYQKKNFAEMDDDMVLLQTYLIYDPNVIRKRKIKKIVYTSFVILLLCYLIAIT